MLTESGQYPKPPRWYQGNYQNLGRYLSSPALKEFTLFKICNKLLLDHIKTPI
jgi:hypothetical protein